MTENIWVSIRDNEIVGTPFGPELPNGKYMLVEKLDSEGGGDPNAALTPPPDAELDALIDAAKAEAAKAIQKFPQPNYVISKVAEEAGEVVKAAIHFAEGRETKEAVLGEVKQAMAMLIRLAIEGDQVHGMAPLLPISALRAKKGGAA